VASPNKSISKLLKLEGGLSDHPLDVGGKTAFGIAAAFWPLYWDQWGGPPTYDQAIQFYINEFWNPLKVEALCSQEIADEVFEQAVNLGKRRAVEFWQMGLVLLHKEVDIDGKVGPQTINATNLLKNSDDIRLVKILNGMQFLYYLYRTNNLNDVLGYMRTLPRDDQDVFFRGWLNRIDLA
jgi:lysozyme family protein